MEIINMAREMGKVLQGSEEYAEFHRAKRLNDDDSALQELIGQFNLKRLDLNKQMNAEQKDEERIAALNTEVRALYSDIMRNENMIVYNDAKHTMDNLMKQINTILSMSINGQNPDEIDISSGCSGDCSGCSSCG